MRKRRDFDWHEFGALVRTIRESRGLSLRQLAELLDVDRSHLSRLERGLVGASYDLVAKAASCLNAPELYTAAGYYSLPEIYWRNKEKAVHERFLSSVVPSMGDPMLHYLELSRDKEASRFVFATPEGFSITVERYRLTPDEIELMPYLRAEVINAKYKGMLNADTPEQDFYHGYVEGIIKAVKILQSLYQTNEDGFFWVLAALFVPPQEARRLADVCSALRMLMCDPDATEAVLAVLNAWAKRAEREEASENTTREEGKADHPINEDKKS